MVVNGESEISRKTLQIMSQISAMNQYPIGRGRVEERRREERRGG